MKGVMHARFSILGGSESLPDEIDIGSHIEDEFVISRAGSRVISNFGSDKWDLSCYNARRIIFDFQGIAKKGDALGRKIVREVKVITFMMLFSGVKVASRIQVKAHSVKRFHSVIMEIAKSAYSIGVTLSEAHKSDEFLMALKSSIVSLDSARKLGAIKILLEYLSRANYQDDLKSYGIPLLVPNDQLKDIVAMINKLSNENSTEPQRTPLIPTRILAELITACEELIEKTAPQLNGVLELVNRVYNDPEVSPAYAISLDTPSAAHSSFKARKAMKVKRGARDVWSWKIEKHNAISFKDAATELNCHEIVSEDRFGIPGFKSLKEYLSSVRKAGEILIHAFTGMRSHEVLVLPFDFFGILEISGLDPIPVIKSFTSKVDAKNYGENTIWVTSKRISKVSEVLQKIALIFHAMNTADPVDTNELPIFVSPNWSLSACTTHYKFPLAKTGQYQEQSKYADPLWFLPGIHIQECDARELQAFDAFREWDKDARFKVGSKWPLSSHQFRRSVAVYASRSGMVSLPSLSTQYKHLSRAMINIYSENSSFAKQIICRGDSIPESHGVIRDFQKSQNFNAAMRFHENVINKKEHIWGGTGKNIQRFKDRDELPLIMSDRVETEKAISRGQLRYTETIVGGCMLNGTCDKYGVYDVVPCVTSCAEAILEDNKVLEYVEGLRFGLRYMDSKSFQHKAALKEIEDITALMEKRD